MSTSGKGTPSTGTPGTGTPGKGTSGTSTGSSTPGTGTPRDKSPAPTAELYRYVLDHNPPLDAVQRELVEVTRARFPASAGMQSAQEQGPLLAFLVRLTGARHIVEVGTFTGFSSLSMAQALPADGRLIACDISEEWTSYAREAWEKAGVADRVGLRLGPALDTLREMPAAPHIDLVYLDADKGGYLDYWEELVPRMRPGGLIVADNVLSHGRVTDPRATGEAAAIRAFNDRVAADARMDAVLLTVADGLTVARRVTPGR
jgi:caffeoyl-CoA O-methyltransferase